MNKLRFLSEDNGYCRVYYRDDKGRLLCYQESMKGIFELYLCTSEGEPSYSIDHSQYVEHTQLPEGNSSTEKLLRKWLVKQVLHPVIEEENDYFNINGYPNEDDMTINDTSRKAIQRIKDVYGKCYLVKINLHGNERGNRDLIAVEAKTHKQTEGDWNVWNFCAAFAAPLISDEIIDLILKRDVLEYECSATDGKKVNEIFARLEELGAHVLNWA